MFTKKPDQKLDYARLARMSAFGALFYGPYQQVWYAALERQWPGRALGNFAAKLLMNQLCLAPVVISAVFAWNLALQNKLSEWPQKMRADVWPTLVNGWKFWIPAASVNFYAVPLNAQVLYMSVCGMAWTGYLSYSAEK
ncbi:hypothetical protein H632_c4021p0, partial [Helicosporidium sp. ATCC 50920]